MMMIKMLDPRLHRVMIKTMLKHNLCCRDDMTKHIQYALSVATRRGCLNDMEFYRQELSNLRTEQSRNERTVSYDEHA